jgi:NitT/TauT family transport system substrate-binding protein
MATGTLLLVAGCSDGPAGDARPGSPSDDSAAPGRDDVVRLAYTAELVQVPALVGIEKGFFTEYLGPDAQLEAKSLAGPTAVDRLLAGTIDAAYLNSHDVIDAYDRSGGTGIRIVAGATSGGAALVVRPDIRSVSDLRGTSIAVPGPRSPQDVALRTFLADNGLQADVDAETDGDVAVVSRTGDELVNAFRSGAIAGAWVAEPWATRLVLDGATVLADERALWPDGEFATTELVVRAAFLDDHRDLVRRLLDGHVRAVVEAAENPVEAQRAALAVLREQTGTALADNVIARAWENLTFTNDPIATSLQKAADDASRVGAGETVDLTEAYDLTLLNQVLTQLGMGQVSS